MVCDVKLSQNVIDVFVLNKADLVRGLCDPDSQSISDFAKIFHLKTLVDFGFEFRYPHSPKNEVVDMGK
jgi:hypothetical protein